MKVFVSYDRSDSKIAHRLAKSLEAAGAKVFSVKELKLWENWSASLERELRGSDEMVVLLTDKSAKSPNVMFEMGLAAGMRLPIVVIEMGVKPELKSSLGIFQHVRYSNLDGYIRRLSDRVRSPKPGKLSSNPLR